MDYISALEQKKLEITNGFGRTLPDWVFHEILQKLHMEVKYDFNGGEWKGNQICNLEMYWQEVILLTLIKKFTMLLAKSCYNFNKICYSMLFTFYDILKVKTIINVVSLINNASAITISATDKLKT
ncbi:hypothetical protein T4E_3742 [Trichinella pseudospiralis]|uniref:Uncharacterized protein n=1 Tax=Trichinella pseudospiralis TaxID=6337 RepID=A0A0V0XL98_TRIPS|nr:hypothetical protein T4E_3742 [Trichinella pseudospiralis]